MQIISKQAVLRPLLQIAMRRDNQPHVNLARLSRTDSRHQSVREHAQQLRLRCHGQLARFVQEELTLMGGFEQALAGAVGPGERAALVSKNSLFSSVSVNAAQLTATSGFAARSLL